MSRTKTIEEVYARFKPGSTEFVTEVESHCGYELSRTEIARLADAAKNAEEFQYLFDSSDTWQDEG